MISSLDSTHDTLLYLPYYLFRSLLTAACVIVKVLKSAYAQDLDQFGAGKKAFNDSVLALGRSSVSNNDTGGKAVKLLSQVWHSDSSSNQLPPELALKSRLGARWADLQTLKPRLTLTLFLSITYDFVWSWRQEFGGIAKQATDSGKLLSVPSILIDSNC